MRYACLLLVAVAACQGPNPAYQVTTDARPTDGPADVASDVNPSPDADPDAGVDSDPDPDLAPDLLAADVEPPADLPLDQAAVDAGPDATADMAPTPDAAPDTAPTPDLAPASGVLGEYYQGRNFETLLIRQIDPKIDFVWGADVPAGVTGTEFSVRWTGRLRPRYSQTYTFAAHSGDGARVWLGGVLVVDNWRLQSPMEATGQIALNAGQLYDFRVEYFHATGWGVMRVTWQSDTQAKEVIPGDRLLPPP